MQEFQCKTFRFTGSVLGKAARKTIKKKYRSNYIWIGDKASDHRLEGYAAAIMCEFPKRILGQKSKGIPLAISTSSLNEIENDDVLLIDPQKELITTLYDKSSNHNAIFVTARCNCACIMCPQPPRPDAEGQNDINKRLIQLMAPGPDSLALTGGEPTILGNELISLIEDCRVKMPETRLLLLTNARKLKDLSYVDSLASAGHPKLSVAVSLYADTEEEHDEIMGVKGAFKETIQGLHNLALYELPVEIRIVIMSMNYMRLIKLADFIYRNLAFACHVVFMGMETCGTAQENLDRIWVDPYEYRKELLEACKFLNQRSMLISIYNHELCVVPEDLWPIARKSISDWKNVYLDVCDECNLKGQCGGFFASAIIKHSTHICPHKIKSEVDGAS